APADTSTLNNRLAWWEAERKKLQDELAEWKRETDATKKRIKELDLDDPAESDSLESVLEVYEHNTKLVNDRLKSLEAQRPTQAGLAPGGSPRLYQPTESWEREVDELRDIPGPEILDPIVEISRGDYADWADVPLEVGRDIVEAEGGPNPTA